MLSSNADEDMLHVGQEQGEMFFLPYKLSVVKKDFTGFLILGVCCRALDLHQEGHPVSVTLLLHLGIKKQLSSSIIFALMLENMALLSSKKWKI